MVKRQNGFAHIGLIILALIVLLVVGFAATKVIHKNNAIDISAACPNPVLQMPTDINHVISVLYPGQYRGGNYKPHGGFRTDNATDNNTVVKAPLAAKLVDGARYTEQGETQILLDFKSNCGVNYRFDHLLTLVPKIQAAVDTLPAPMEEASQTHDFKKPFNISLGEDIATAVGFTKTHNVSFDFGVYDFRQPNIASKDASFEAAHANDGALDMVNHAVCWLNYLPPADGALLKTLPGGDHASGKNSDYCK